MLDINKFVKIEEIKHNLTRAQVAHRLHLSPQALSSRIVRGTLKVRDLEQIALAMDCDLKVEFVKHE